MLKRRLLFVMVKAQLAPTLGSVLGLSRLCSTRHTKPSPVSVHNEPAQTQPAAAACQAAPLGPGPLHSHQVSHCQHPAIRVPMLWHLNTAMVIRCSQSSDWT